MSIDIFFLDKDKNVISTWLNAACYAGIHRRLMKHKPTYVQTRLPTSYDWTEAQINEYYTIITELFPRVDKKIGINNLIKEWHNNKSWTLPVNLNAFDTFAICNILRYLQEDWKIVNNFFTITNQYPKLPKWKAFVLAHSNHTFGSSALGHSFIFPVYGTMFIPMNINPHKVMVSGRKAVKYKTALNHGRYGSGYLNDTFMNLYEVIKDNDNYSSWYDGSVKPHKNIPEQIKRMVELGEQAV